MGKEVPCPTCGGRGLVSEADDGAPADLQTLSDTDQTASDHDQTWADHDQTASDRDQRSSDADQQAADDDDDDQPGTRLAAVHERTARTRAQGSLDRQAVSDERDRTATTRSGTADERDRAAELRDRAAEGRDLLARFKDLGAAGSTPEEVVTWAAEARRRAAVDRARASEDRARAALDREEAARQRIAADRARDEAKEGLVKAATDELTGAWTRKFGLAELAHEVERARRTHGQLLLAFVDVDDLKAVNDTGGHSKGDQLLRLAAETMRSNLRPYDVIVRYGGDEFLCAMPNITREGASMRMKAIAAELAGAEPHHAISFGLAAYGRSDELQDLIDRADADLLVSRASRRSRRA